MRQRKTASETWIRNAWVITQDSKRAVFEGSVRIVDDFIAEVRKGAPSRISSGTKVVEGRGRALIPGFVQAHIHLCQTLFRNLADDLELLEWLSERIWVYEAAHSHSTLRTSALLGIHELLSGGTTCILDMGTVRHTGSIIEAVRETGIRASVGKCLMDHPKTTPPTLREKTRDALHEAKSLFAQWNGAENDRIRVSYAPRFVVSCTEELLLEVARLSREQGALIHTHASENLKEIQLVKKLVNCENIEYLDQLGLASDRLVLAHCIWLKPNELGILKRTDTSVAHCPSSNLKLASGIARIPEMRQKGIRVALGADGAPCNNSLSAFQEMRLAALIQKPGNGPRSMRAQEALDMATREGAKALHWFDKIGSIEVGKRADLTLVNLSHPENLAPVPRRPKDLAETLVSSLVYSAQSQHVEGTWVDGKLLYWGGRVRSIDRDKLVKDAREAQRQILSRRRR
ncbi:MAG: 5'-deoxyadenosine deaminase [Bdellovibrionales bacterium]|nr:5'-deoxyadenosine deaminase [Bdellovibrionales bacterium]